MSPPWSRMRTFLAMGYDIGVATILWAGSIAMRYGLSPAPASTEMLRLTTPVVVGVEFLMFFWFGLYRGFWRYASPHDIKQILKAVALSGLTVPLALMLIGHNLGIPRSALVLNPLLLILFMVGGRVLFRWWKEHRPYGIFRDQGRPVLLLGAGNGALGVLSALERNPSWYAVGLLDDNRNKLGRDLAGVKVHGTWDELKDVAARTGAKHAILTTGDDSSKARRRAFEQCRTAGMKLLIVPGVDDVISGRVQLSALRDIEVDDLLGRDPVELNMTGLRQWISGRNVVVTGAGGSIGSELCRQIAKFNPDRLILLEENEFALYQVDELLGREFARVPRSAVICDIRDAEQVNRLFTKFKPALVFHAAAYKHVPLMEGENAAQALSNNVNGTLVIAYACVNHEVDKLVFISTDKAINPTSVMGASKRMAEMVLQHLHRRDELSAIIVRFGNVLGTTGSVIPKFKEQIAAGGPVTVTHPDMVRYFMSVTEATQLILQAGMMGNGGEVFMLDMGEPVRIVDLARDMIRLSGYDEEDIRITYSGLRPGEKLFEELLANDETTLPTPHTKLRVYRTMEPPGPAWFQRVHQLVIGAAGAPAEQVRGALMSFVPEYRPAAGLAALPLEPVPTDFSADLPPA